jgi:hypothetical protein
VLLAYEDCAVLMKKGELRLRQLKLTYHLLKALEGDS